MWKYFLDCCASIAWKGIEETASLPWRWGHFWGVLHWGETIWAWTVHQQVSHRNDTWRTLLNYKWCKTIKQIINVWGPEMITQIYCELCVQISWIVSHIPLQNCRSSFGSERTLSSHVPAGWKYWPELHSRKSTAIGFSKLGQGRVFFLWLSASIPIHLHTKCIVTFIFTPN